MNGTVSLYMGVSVGGCQETRKELMRRGREVVRERGKGGKRTHVVSK